MKPAHEQLRDYLDGFRARAQAALNGEHQLDPGTELAAAMQAIGAWDAVFGNLPTQPQVCESCDDD